MARQSRNDGPTGFVVVNKDPDWTSHDVVAKLRGLLHQRRTGHAGTLDPSATGVLLVGLGRATRLLRFLQTTNKAYDGTFALGSTTNTLDSDGEITERFDMGSVDLNAVQSAAATLTGEILQVPPMVSAVKVDGRRLYDLAREGKEVERAARSVRVDRFDIGSTEDDGVFRFDIACSTGTYVRSLVDDLGKALNGGAHVTSLRRTAVGSFTLDESHRLEEITSMVHDAPSVEESGVMLNPAEALRDLEMLVVDDEVVQLVARGTVFPTSRFAPSSTGPYALVDPSGTLLAVYEVTQSVSMKPSVVLMDQGGQQ